MRAELSSKAVNEYLDIHQERAEPDATRKSMRRSTLAVNREGRRRTPKIDSGDSGIRTPDIKPKCKALPEVNSSNSSGESSTRYGI